MHETYRKPDAIGEATPTSDPIAKEGQDIVGSGTNSRFISKFCISMATGLSRRRGEGFNCPSGPGASSQAFGGEEEGPCRTLDERPLGFWLQHGYLDHSTCCRGNPKTSASSLSSQPYLASADRVGMELSEARAKGKGEERRRDRTLEEEALAHNKKKPSNLGPIWPFSMKVGFCSYQMSVGHGLPEDEPQSCIISIGGRGSRLSLRLPYRQSGDTWGFISISMRKISRQWMSQSFCITFCNTSAVMSSYCGTGLLSIRENLSAAFVTSILVSMWNGFLGMPLNSIQMSLFGPRLNADYPIVHLMGQRPSNGCYAPKRYDSNARNISYHLVSVHLNYHGDTNIIFH